MIVTPFSPFTYSAPAAATSSSPTAPQQLHPQLSGNGYWVNTTGCSSILKSMDELANAANMRAQQGTYGLPHNPITIVPCSSQQSVSSSDPTTQVATEIFSQILPPPSSYAASITAPISGRFSAANMPALQPQIMESLYPQLKDIPSCHFVRYPSPVIQSNLPWINANSGTPTVFFGQLPCKITRAGFLEILISLNLSPNSLTRIHNTSSGTYCLATFNDHQKYLLALFLHRRILFDINGYFFNPAIAAINGEAIFRTMLNASQQAAAEQTKHFLPHGLLVAEPAHKKHPSQCERPHSHPLANAVVAQDDQDDNVLQPLHQPPFHYPSSITLPATTVMISPPPLIGRRVTAAASDSSPQAAVQDGGLSPHLNSNLSNQGSQVQSKKSSLAQAFLDPLSL